ncbi:FAD:protein FMN transferase [Neobacillus sp. LXY-1]|uniref:FAD:protein FMN transferase n=1 Tax=Neobacillus sp. LXY-1 TaxID=3379133 RepID=UPI003EE2CD58
MFTYQFNSMSTLVKICINREMFANDLMPIYKLFEFIEDTCSRFKQNSELSNLNRHLDQEFLVSNELFALLARAEEFFQETDGLFHPGILENLEINGYADSIEVIRGQDLDMPSLGVAAAVQVRPYTINETKQTVTLHTKIDLGGIAKGWVIDRATELLDKIGFGFMNVGGDIRIFGTLPRSLNIGIENPFEGSSLLSSIQIKTGALATSTSAKRKWSVNGKQKHHLIDPRTGLPSDSTIVSATVTAPTAVEADVLAKTVLLLGKHEGKVLIQKKGVKAVLILDNGEIWKGAVEDGNV